MPQRQPPQFFPACYRQRAGLSSSSESIVTHAATGDKFAAASHNPHLLGNLHEPNLFMLPPTIALSTDHRQFTAQKVGLRSKRRDEFNPRFAQPSTINHPLILNNQMKRKEWQ
jgi:hypothetical protein